MAEPTSSAGLASAGLGVLLVKFFPAGLGAAIMVCVDPPATRLELFMRLFVAGASMYLFGDVAFDFLKTFHAFAFLDYSKRSHAIAVEGVVGGLGWFVLGAAATFGKRFRADPTAAIADARKAAQ